MWDLGLEGEDGCEDGCEFVEVGFMVEDCVGLEDVAGAEVGVEVHELDEDEREIVAWPSEVEVEVEVV